MQSCQFVSCQLIRVETRQSKLYSIMVWKEFYIIYWCDLTQFSYFTMLREFGKFQWFHNVMKNLDKFKVISYVMQYNSDKFKLSQLSWNWSFPFWLWHYLQTSLILLFSSLVSVLSNINEKFWQNIMKLSPNKFDPA